MQQTEKRPAVAPPLFEGLVADEREMLRIVIDAIPDPVFVRDRAGRHILDNRAHRTTFNLFKRNPLGATVFELHPREHALLYAADDERVMSTGVPILNREEPFTTTSGERGWFLTCKFPLRDAARNVTGVVGICRDITELKRASEALRENERLYHTLVAATNTGYALVNERGFVLDVNDEFVRLTGYTLRADVVGRALSEWTALHDLERSTREMATCLQTGAIRNVEIDYVAADGRIVPVEMNARMQRTAAGPRIVLFCRDISVRRRAEAERGMVDRRLQEKQKLESLGVMAGGIAHDFNNLLTGILGNATLAASKLADPALRHCLEQIETAAMRAGDLCHQMLAYAGKGRFHIRPLSLNSIISETISLLRISIKKNATLDLVLAPDLPPVLADATQMRQIIMNLVINASEAITDSTGHIRVQTRVMSLDRLFDGGAPPGQDALEGTFVAIEVRDDGAGMSPEVQARIFDPFFTTKFTGRGLGLAAVLGIVRGHRGTLHVESEPGCGTLFRVLLPVADASPELQPAIPDAADSWRGSGTVLVIDDEEAVRTTTAALLELLGFDVLVAPDGRVGVQIFSKAAETVRLVLLDLTMPHFSGEETLRAIRELRPDAAILLMSGFTEQDVARRFHGTELAGFLPKPFMLSTLRKKLYEVLVAHHSVQPCAEVVGAA